MTMQSTREIAASRRSEQGFEVFALENGIVGIEVVPELGAKVISLRDLVTGCEWMWHPPAGMKLFGNRPGDDFSASTMTGWDECIPTISPCRWKGRDLPDHGEAWSVPWEIDLGAFGHGALKTSLFLPVSPLYFERSIHLCGNEIHLEYLLENHGCGSEEFLWAMHPLLPADDGSRLRLTAEAEQYLSGASWIEGLAFESGGPACAKAFAGPLREGNATLVNNHGRHRISFEWDTTRNDMLGLWLTRGGWCGYHHVALEPANGSPDSLADAAANMRCGLIEPGERQSWNARISLGNGF